MEQLSHHGAVPEVTLVTVPRPTVVIPLPGLSHGTDRFWLAGGHPVFLLVERERFLQGCRSAIRGVLNPDSPSEGLGKLPQVRPSLNPTDTNISDCIGHPGMKAASHTCMISGNSADLGCRKIDTGYGHHCPGPGWLSKVARSLWISC